MSTNCHHNLARLRVAQLTLDTLIEPTPSLFSKPTPDSKVPNEHNRFRRFKGVATVKMSTDEIMSLTRGDYQKAISQSHTFP